MERAMSVKHVEFALLKHLLETVDLSALEQRMVPDGDEHAQKRYNAGCENICKIVEGLADRRAHKLPKDHPLYKAKEE
jgi:hypothetical protein